MKKHLQTVTYSITIFYKNIYKLFITGHFFKKVQRHIPLDCLQKNVWNSHVFGYYWAILLSFLYFTAFSEFFSSYQRFGTTTTRKLM